MNITLNCILAFLLANLSIAASETCRLDVGHLTGDETFGLQSPILEFALSNGAVIGATAGEQQFLLCDALPEQSDSIYPAFVLLIHENQDHKIYRVTWQSNNHMNSSIFMSVSANASPSLVAAFPEDSGGRITINYGWEKVAEYSVSEGEAPELVAIFRARTWEGNPGQLPALGVVSEVRIPLK